MRNRPPTGALDQRLREAAQRLPWRARAIRTSMIPRDRRRSRRRSDRRPCRTFRPARVPRPRHELGRNGGLHRVRLPESHHLRASGDRPSTPQRGWRLRAPSRAGRCDRACLQAVQRLPLTFQRPTWRPFGQRPALQRQCPCRKRPGPWQPRPGSGPLRWASRDDRRWRCPSACGATPSPAACRESSPQPARRGHRRPTATTPGPRSSSTRGRRASGDRAHHRPRGQPSRNHRPYHHRPCHRPYRHPCHRPCPCRCSCHWRRRGRPRFETGSCPYWGLREGRGLPLDRPLPPGSPGPFPSW